MIYHNTHDAWLILFYLLLLFAHKVNWRVRYQWTFWLSQDQLNCPEALRSNDDGIVPLYNLPYKLSWSPRSKAGSIASLHDCRSLAIPQPNYHGDTVAMALQLLRNIYSLPVVLHQYKSAQVGPMKMSSITCTVTTLSFLSKSWFEQVEHQSIILI